MDSSESTKRINRHNELYRSFLDSCCEIYPEIDREAFNDGFQNVILNLTTFGSKGLIVNHKRFIEKMKEPEMKKLVSEINKEVEERKIEDALMDVYCDKRFFWSRELCGGQLYNINGKDRFVKSQYRDESWFVGKCTRCGKTHWVER